MTRNELLKVEDLSVLFRTERGMAQAVDSVSLHIDRGETLAIVGESGSGKSVTALSIMGLLADSGRVDRGQIVFEGTDLLHASKADMLGIRGNRIGMIFQEPMSSLNPVLTIGQQVAEPLRIHRGLSKAVALEHAADLLATVAIPDARERLGDYPHHFSGGMRQRVMIAMALACEPSLIIADEPTTALDVTVQAQILSLLKGITQDTGAALILITHDLGVVARYADRVAVMYAGRIVETADARTLYKTPAHPYTRGLMESIPGLEGEAGKHLPSIEGQPPNLDKLPPGCAFSPRCKHSAPQCDQSHPPLESISATHLKACFHNA